MFDLSGKKILVIGLARTGVATSLFCAKHGATVTAVDKRGDRELSDVAAQLRALGIKVILGETPGEDVFQQELVIPSPGVPANGPLLQSIRLRKIPIWSEIELADRFLNGRLIGITGSNGKTTTTSLIDHILKNSGFNTLLAGNIGTPLIDVVEKTTDQTVTVAELSNSDRLIGRFFNYVDQRRADISGKEGIESRIFENVIDERGRCGFTVRTSNANEAAIQEAVGQFDFAPNRDLS